MRPLRGLLVATAIAIASPASAATIHGLVFDDTNGDGAPQAGEPGITNAVVAAGAKVFTTTNASGEFDLDVGDAAGSWIVWVRVPDGFRPGPVWARWDGTGDIDLGLRRFATPLRGPLTFVVASDTHLGIAEAHTGAAELARAARLATSLESPPAFFTILGDITQGSRPEEYDVVEQGLADLEVPWIPVPGNHDWYDGGAAWISHWGPDNYSFDIRDVHFVVWNMALPPDQLRAYLGADLRRVASDMTIVALSNLGASNPGAIVDGIAAVLEPSLAPKQPAPVADNDPNARQRLETILAAARDGTLSPNDFAYVRAGFFPNAANAYKAALAGVGAPTKVILFERQQLGDDVISTYEVVYGARTLRVRLGLAPDGKVSVFTLRPR